MSSLSRIGQINHRAQRASFGIRQLDRLSHIYVIGQTGVGKSTLLENFAAASPAKMRLNTPSLLQRMKRL